MTETSRPAFAQKVEAAFADTVYPGDDNIIFFHIAKAEILRDFQGKHWRELSLEILLWHYDRLHFMTDAGFHFYLPAYLIATLLHPKADNLFGDTVLYLLTPHDKPYFIRDFLRRATLFSAQQSTVLATYFDNFLELYPEYVYAYGNVPDLMELDSAANFWRENAERGFEETQ